MKKIVVVDDNQEICALIKTLLETEGYLVVCCVNPILAEEILKKEKPLLLITDMLMSGVDGRTLVKQLRNNANFESLKIVLMSAHPMVSEHSKMISADDYISKPFEIDELTSKVKNLIGA